MDKDAIRKQLLDQSLHMIAAFIIMAPLLLFMNIWGALWAGLGIGIVREITEEGNPVTFSKIKRAFSFWSCVDIIFWAIGAMLAFILIL